MYPFQEKKGVVRGRIYNDVLMCFFVAVLTYFCCFARLRLRSLSVEAFCSDGSARHLG